MQNKHHPLLDSHPYQLSEDGHIKLQEIRDQLFFLAALAYPQTEPEDGVLLEVTRSALGESFERFAGQINEVLHHAVTRPHVSIIRQHDSLQ